MCTRAASVNQIASRKKKVTRQLLPRRKTVGCPVQYLVQILAEVVIELQTYLEHLVIRYLRDVHLVEYDKKQK